MGGRWLAGSAVLATALALAVVPARAAVVDLAAPDSQPGFFQAPPVSFALGQANAGATPLDVFAAFGQFGGSRVQVRTTNTPGNWRMVMGVIYSIQEISTAGSPNDIALADVTGDGNVDIGVAYNGGVARALGAPSGSYGSFGTPAGSPADPMTGVAFGPVDANGSLDLIASGPSSVDVYPNTGNPTTPFSSQSPNFVEFNAALTDVAAADLDGDGDTDAATATGSTRRAFVLLNNGSGALNQTRSAGLFTRPEAVVTADVAGGPRPELLVTEPDRDTVAIVSTANLPATLGPIRRIDTGTAPVDVATADLDGDGRLEIVTANAGSDSVTVAEEGGASRSFAAGQNPAGVATGDVTGDGRPDVVVANDATNGVSVLANLGVPLPPPTPAPPPAAAPGPPPTSPAAKRSAKLRCTASRRGGKVRIVCTATLSDRAAAERLTARLLRKGGAKVLATVRVRPGRKLTFALRGGVRPGFYVVKLSVANGDDTTLSTARAIRVRRKR